MVAILEVCVFPASDECRQAGGTEARSNAWSGDRFLYRKSGSGMKKKKEKIDLSVAACDWLLFSIHSPRYHGSRILLLSSHAHTHEAMQTVKHTHTPSVCITLLLHSSLLLLYE